MKKYRRVMSHDTEEKLTRGSKDDIRNLVNFNASSGKCENMHFDTLFYQKYIRFEPKKYRGVLCRNAEERCKIWGGADLCFEKWHEESGKFWLNSWKSPNLYFNRLLLSKVYNVWTEKLQRSYASWHWRVMRYLKKNWLVVGKMT